MDYIASPKCVVNKSSPNRHPPIPHTHIISSLLPTGMYAPTLCILDGGRNQGKGIVEAFSAYYIDFVLKFAKPSQKLPSILNIFIFEFAYANIVYRK